MTTRRKPMDWLVINPSRGGSFDCLRCGESYLPTYPIPVDVMSAISKALEKTHRRCTERLAGKLCEFCLKAGHDWETCPRADVTTLDAWLAGPDTGISSRAIVHALTGRGHTDTFGWRPPSDPSDFGRCHRLLTRFPELRARLGDLAAKLPDWAPFVREWDRMTALYERERPTGNAPELYALMRGLEKEGRGA